MKLRIFCHNLFEPIYFLVSKYYSKLTYQRYQKYFKNKIINKNVYIFGAGPSLDKFKLNKIENSVIIFINGSIEKLKKIKGNNQVFWATSDVTKIYDFSFELPKNFKCIVTSSKYRGVLHIILSNKRYLYFHPNPTIGIKRFNFLSTFSGKIPILYPKILDSSVKNIKKIIYKNTVTLTGGTSMLFILVAITTMGPKTISIAGFDMGSVKNKLYASLKYYKKEINNKTDRFDFSYTKIVYDKILISLKKKKIKFYNYSIFKLEKFRNNSELKLKKSKIKGF